MKTVWKFLKWLNVQLSYNTTIPLLGIHQKELKHMSTQMYTNVHNSCIHNSQKGKQPNSPWTDEWIKNVKYPYNELLFGNKNKWNIYIYHNIVDLWKHYFKRKRPVTKDHILYVSIYMKCENRQIYRDRK